MKCLMLLALTCSMIGLPVNAVNSPTTVKVFVTSRQGETLMKGYLKRELHKLDGFKVVADNPLRGASSKWEIHAVSVRLDNGLYAVAIGIVRNRYIKPYLRKTIKSDLKELLGTIPEYSNTVVHTGYDLERLCADIIVVVEDHIRN